MAFIIAGIVCAIVIGVTYTVAPGRLANNFGLLLVILAAIAAGILNKKEMKQEHTMKNSIHDKLLIHGLVFIFLFAISTSTVSSKENKAGNISFTVMLSEKNCQMAIWLADAKGTFIDTVSVTRKTAQDGMGNRPGKIDDKIGGARLSTLPVWAHARGVDYGGGNFYPPREKPLVDAITSASPMKGKLVINWRPQKALKPGLYYYFIEVNTSFNKNKWHNYSWYRGQPSVVWKGSITVSNSVSSGKARVIGHGHPAGADGRINPDISTLTTALKVIESAEATYIP